MQAVVYERYGPPEVLAVREVERPAVTPTGVLVRVHAAGVGAGDWHLLTGRMWVVRFYQGLFRPKRRILGHDVAGRVEAVGENVTRFRPGDAVFGACPQAGAFAEFVCVPEDQLVPIPAGLSDVAAAAVPNSAITALQGLRDEGRLRAGMGMKVLVNGASGGVGTFAVQIARTFDAEVTGVCSAEKAELVRSLGAHRVLDYRREDFTRRDERYDVVLDLAGKQRIADCRRVLTPEGFYVAAAGAPSRMLRVALAGGPRTAAFLARPNAKDLAFLADLLAAGEIHPVVERTYPLRETAAAIRHVGEGRARGKVVVTVA